MLLCRKPGEYSGKKSAAVRFSQKLKDMYNLFGVWIFIKAVISISIVYLRSGFYRKHYTYYGMIVFRRLPAIPENMAVSVPMAFKVLQVLRNMYVSMYQKLLSKSMDTLIDIRAAGKYVYLILEPIKGNGL